MADDSSGSSPQQSPSSDSSPPPPSSDSSTSPPTSDSSSSSPPPSSPPPPSDDSSGGGESSGNSSPSPPPPDSSSGSPPPPSSEGSQSSPPPPSESNNDGGGNNSGENQSKSPPAPAEQFAAPAPPGSRPREQPPLAPPRSTDNQSSNGYSPSESPSSSPSSSSNGTSVIVGLVVAGGLLILLVIACVLCSRRKRRKPTGGPPYGWESAPPPHGTKHTGNQYWQSSAQDHAVKIPPNSSAWGHTSGGGDESGGPYSGGQINTPLAPSPSLTLGFNKSTFTYEELAAATNNFDRSRMLGQGGFGYVHKGMLPNGKEIAVKSLKSGSGQGEREFQSEVEIISRVHHRHLVSLVGYCIAGGQRMLVYEFVPNDTLEYHLHKKSPPLDFSTRVRIALGSAKGLGYLHEDCHPRIIHRDIKASNILLDENYEAMVADFGLAKLTTDTNTHVSTRVMGTFGYLAPEYASSGKLTEKSDVFSYGVMLLELITGRRPVDPNMKYMEDSLVDWSRPLLAKALETGNYEELADPRLERNYNPQEMQRMVACAAASIRHSAKKRPKMSQIVRALEGDVSLDDLNDGGKTAAFSSSEGSDYDTRAYSADLKKFRQMAFATQDFASSEYGGGTTSEYGLNPSSSSSDNSTRDMNSEKLHPKF